VSIIVYEIFREEGFVYVAFILDACSHKMVG
jgi:putative transposase